MTTPHKWAAEIHAMADGRKVEGRNQVLRYRVALKQNRFGEKWLSFVTTEEEAGILEHVIAFVEWLGDWQEVEI